jgi:hypothetical protein
MGRPTTTQKIHSVLRRAGFAAAEWGYSHMTRGYRVQDQRGLRRLVVVYHDGRHGDADGFAGRQRDALAGYAAALDGAGIPCAVERGVVVVADYAPAKPRRRPGA